MTRPEGDSPSPRPADTLDKPQIMVHASHKPPSGATPFDARWLPGSAKAVVLGQNARGTGTLQVLELDGPQLKIVKETEYGAGLKCGTFGASLPGERRYATGDFAGKLAIWDIERLEMPVFAVRAHADIVNCIDGCGGTGALHGPPEIVTGGRDGAVKVWDVRERDRPVADISPGQGQQPRDAWCVAFGNSYNEDERCVAAGYDNGDLKMFDLRAMKLIWETNLKNGVCGVQFDRKDIKMNKVVCTTLEASFTVFDVRTFHPKKGFASLTEKKAHGGTTIWTVRHLPQNRDVFMTGGGDGSVSLYKYNYPAQRSRKNDDGEIEGVAGNVSLLNSAHVAEQPVSSFDWSPDKQGLCVFTTFDQMVRVGVVTKLAQL